MIQVSKNDTSLKKDTSLKNDASLKHDTSLKNDSLLKNDSSLKNDLAFLSWKSHLGSASGAQSSMEPFHGGTGLLQAAIDAITAANAAQATSNMEQLSGLITQMGQQQQTLVASMQQSAVAQTTSLVESMMSVVGRLRPLAVPPPLPAAAPPPWTDAAPLYGGGPDPTAHGWYPQPNSQPMAGWPQPAAAPAAAPAQLPV